MAVIAVQEEEVAVTDSRCGDLDQHFPGTWVVGRDVVDGQRLSTHAHQGCLHRITMG